MENGGFCGVDGVLQLDIRANGADPVILVWTFLMLGHFRILCLSQNTILGGNERASDLVSRFLLRNLEILFFQGAMQLEDYLGCKRVGWSIEDNRYTFFLI